MKIEYIIGIVGILLAIGLASYGIYQSNQGEWVCIAEACENILTGEEWISNFCRPGLDDNGQSTLMCKMAENNYNYLVPLDKIDTTQIKGCLDYKCVVEIKVKEYGG